MSAGIGRTDDLPSCLAIRRAVFVEEQGVALSEDVDGRDGEAIQLLLRIDGVPAGTARILIGDGVGKIGRVAVLPAHRGKGHGAGLVRHALDILRADETVGITRLGAQTQAMAFYEALGFVATGPEYLDAGLPHRDMEQPV